MFVQLMVRVRCLPQRKARLAWTKFKKWLHRENTGEQREQLAAHRPITLWLANNTDSSSFRKAIAVFKEMLPSEEKLKLDAVQVKHRADKCLGLQAFVP
jgi:hypothetical protein